MALLAPLMVIGVLVLGIVLLQGGFLLWRASRPLSVTCFALASLLYLYTAGYVVASAVSLALPG